jgi:hypothetical protein
VIALGVLLGLVCCGGRVTRTAAAPEKPRAVVGEQRDAGSLAPDVPRDGGQRDAAGVHTTSPHDAGVRDNMATESLDALLARARDRSGKFVPATPAELKRVAAAVNKLLRGLAAHKSLAPVRKALAKEHFELVRTRLGSAPALAMVEAGDHRQGRGFYVFSENASERAPIVQVPHSFYDEDTLPIGLAVASRGARALFVNTVHRYASGAPAAKGGDASPARGPAHLDESANSAEAAASSDLAHQTESVWQVLSECLLARFPASTIIQLHGFADKADPEHLNTAVVVSPSVVKQSETDAVALAARLGSTLAPLEVRLYPRDTKLLGATKNKQAQLSAAHPPAGFMHIEMSRTLRKRLVAESALLESYVRAVEVVGASPGVRASE